jgi:nitroreductase
VEFDEVLMTRRSIRSYLDRPVDEAAVEAILRAAMAAPSAGNQRPWHFVVVREQATMQQIMKVHEYSDMLETAPVCIAVCAELALEKFEGFWVQDTSAAMQNMLLKARDLELGSVWLGVHPIESRRQGLQGILNLPDGVVCLGLMALGYTDRPFSRVDRFEPERVHLEAW